MQLDISIMQCYNFVLFLLILWMWQCYMVSVLLGSIHGLLHLQTCAPLLAFAATRGLQLDQPTYSCCYSWPHQCPSCCSCCYSADVVAAGVVTVIREARSSHVIKLAMIKVGCAMLCSTFTHQCSCTSISCATLLHATTVH